MLLGAIFILGIPWNITIFFALVPIAEALLGPISFPCIHSGGTGWGDFGKSVFISLAIGMFINISLVTYALIDKQESNA